MTLQSHYRFLSITLTVIALGLVCVTLVFFAESILWNLLGLPIAFCALGAIAAVLEARNEQTKDACCLISFHHFSQPKRERLFDRDAA